MDLFGIYRRLIGIACVLLLCAPLTMAARKSSQKRTTARTHSAQSKSPGVTKTSRSGKSSKSSRSGKSSKSSKASVSADDSDGSDDTRSTKTAKRSTRRSKSKRSRRGESTEVAQSRPRGQRGIDGDRVREIQEALIREHYLDGEATGVWDARTKDAMVRYQVANGWQKKLVPDSRALIKLGLGPKHANALNPVNTDAGVEVPSGPLRETQPGGGTPQ